jgi:3-deoxy-manno-octulosonate cytidylyltransferase (CMP-KDO synthetase)
MASRETYAVIPARYFSTRFPGKPLVPLLGKPMVLWVAEACEKALGRDSVIIATDDVRISQIVEDAGFISQLTSPEALTGTDRVAEVARLRGGETIINVQGDEPMVSPVDILKIADIHEKNPERVVNGYISLAPFENPANTNIPKVVLDEFENLLYISRQAIPGNKKGLPNPGAGAYLKQVCIYAFSPQQLETFARNPRRAPLESEEDIEILRFLELGQRVQMVRTSAQTLAIDVPADVEVVEQALRIMGYH